MKNFRKRIIKAKRAMFNQTRTGFNIRLKNNQELSLMRDSCHLAADVLRMIAEHVVEGVSTYDLDRLCHEFIVAQKAYPSPLNYHGFPKSICTSVNNVICHGIPSKKDRLKKGDIVNLDVTVYRNGFHGDTNRMFHIDPISDEALQLIRVTEESMYRGIATISPQNRLGDLGHAVQSYVESLGYSVVRDYLGHGIGKDFHEDPPVPHIGLPGSGVHLKTGMTFTVEPMINQGSFESQVLEDGWTAVTQDRKLSAQFEHTVLVLDHGCEIMTLMNELPQGRHYPWPSKLK